MAETNHTAIINGMDKIQKILSGKSLNIIIITHFNPDGDAIGSTLALKLILSKRGHFCTVVVPNDFPDFLKWLPGAGDIIALPGNETEIARSIKSCDVLFYVDFNDIRRMKGIQEPVLQSSATRILIDHHPDPFVIVDGIMSDTSVSSTAELVYRFISLMGLKESMDDDIALCLYTGIMTDTGCFSYNSSAPVTYTTVADLLQYNFSKDKAYYRIYDNFSCERMRLLGFCLNGRMEYYPEYRTAMIWISRRDQEIYKFKTGDSEGFVNYPLSIKGVRFSAFFIEKEDHIKVSFRSKGNFAVNTFSADYFNGGGHRNASGGESYDTLEETLKKFRGLLPKFSRELNDYED
jgi:bifunctional oligoribonuclease and PAP phosphatase NrnA